MRFSQLFFKKFAGIAAAIAILPVAVACNNTATTDTAETPMEEEVVTDEVVTDEPAAAEGDTIVDVAAANGSFSTLVSAIEAAGLTETLNGEGPYTVFAPTDEAFAALPEGTLDKLLLPENKEVLTQILTYHVVPGEVMAADVTTGPVATVEGSELDVVSEGGNVTVNGATVSEADVTASNGVIHVIDTVLIPESVDVSSL